MHIFFQINVINSIPCVFYKFRTPHVEVLSCCCNMVLPSDSTWKHLALKARELYWIIGKHSPLSLTNKVLIYKAILKPAWTYGIELWAVLPQLIYQSFRDINPNTYVS